MLVCCIAVYVDARAIAARGPAASRGRGAAVHVVAVSGRRCAIGPLLRAHIWRRRSGITGAPMAAQTVCGVLVLMLVQLSACASGCSTNADCSLNGVCVSNTCVCDKPWSVSVPVARGTSRLCYQAGLITFLLFAGKGHGAG